MLKFKYHHYRDARNRPMVTQCFIYNEEQMLLTVGTALCSLKDNPEKKIGRALARDRALLALGDYQDGEEYYKGFDSLNDSLKYSYTEYFKGPYFSDIINSVKHSPLDGIVYKSFVS